MSWCDKLASTPAVGFRFSPHHQSADSILHAISPLLDKWAKPLEQGFTIERHESFGIHLLTDDGFQYVVDARRMFVEFKHRLRIKPQSGGPPIAEMLSKPRQFTSMLPEVSSRLIEAFSLINGPRSQMLERVGIVTTTPIEGNEAPPGVIRLIQYLTKPWSDGLDNYQITISSNLKKTEEYVERCIHTIIRPEDPDQLMTIKFDWQRVFTNPIVATEEILKKQVASAEVDALKYFEELGEGSRFDERILGNQA